MKSIVFFAVLLMPFKIIAQEPTLKETQAWIQDKIESYPLISEGTDQNRFHEVDFEDGHLNIRTFNGELIDDYPYRTNSIYIRDIKKVTIYLDSIVTEKGIEELGDINVTLMSIKCWSDTLAMHRNEHENISGLCWFTILLHESFIKNDLPERMEKAFRHLVKLHGGEMLKEVF